MENILLTIINRGGHMLSYQYFKTKTQKQNIHSQNRD